MTAAAMPTRTATKKRTTLGDGTDDPDVNPFQVYPVLGLSEVRDIRAITVATKEIQEVHKEVVAYAEAFNSQTDPPAKLLLAARGDFGTGKTHLMLYAQSVLVSERAQAEWKRAEERKERKLEPSAPGETLAPVVAIVVSSEARIEEWYVTELGPTLIEVAAPRELVRELLTRIACDEASAEHDPELQELAKEFRTSRRALYQAFRNPGEFDVSAVEERFNREIEAACPRTSRSFRRAIAALRWEETAEIAEDWLAGNELSSEEMIRLGVRQGDRATRAANMICATASLCLRLKRPFGLFIDEFEHLTRYDDRDRSKRNITWIKRLVELLARRGAMVFICGHWDAWDQKGDFLDRFVGGRPIQLVRLDAEDILKVVTARAGEKAWEGFTKASARAVVEETSGNIRRVMTVLYDLWADETLAATDVVTPEIVRLAAYRRLQPGSEAGILPTIERAIRGNGGEMRRDEPFGKPPEEVDATARLNGELRLIVRVIHARDELALLDGGTRFATLVKAVRASNPIVHGLCVTLGAVIEKHVLALDAAYPETDLVNGEAPDAIEHLPGIVAKALAPALPSEPTSNAEALVALGQTRSSAILRADAQAARTMEVIGTGDSRADAVRQAASADPIELANLKAEQARTETYNLIMEDAKRPVAAQFIASSPRSVAIVATTVITALFWAAAVAVRLCQANFQASEPTAATATASGGVELARPLPELLYVIIVNAPIIIPVLSAIGGFLMLIDLWLCWRLYTDIGEFRRYRIQTIRRMFADGAPAFRINQVNALFERYLVKFGPRLGRISVVRDLVTAEPAGISSDASPVAPSSSTPMPPFGANINPNVSAAPGVGPPNEIPQRLVPNDPVPPSLR